LKDTAGYDVAPLGGRTSFVPPVDLDDPDRALHAELVSPPTRGHLIPFPDGSVFDANGDFNYQADSTLFGQDAFTYTVDDGFAASMPGTVTIREDLPVPILRTDSYVVGRGQSLTVGGPSGLVANDTFPNGQPLLPFAAEVDYFDFATHGDLSSSYGTNLFYDHRLEQDGGFTYTPASDYTGPDSFQYHVKYGRSTVPDVPFEIHDTLELSMLATVLIDVVDGPQSDSDGIADGVEDRGTGYDGNRDGMPDARQDNVASLPDNIDGSYVTFVSDEPGSKLFEVGTTNNPSPGDAPGGNAFPLGFFHFKVTGLSSGSDGFNPHPEAADVDLISPVALPPDFIYYRYGPTPDNRSSHWYAFNYDGRTGAELVSPFLVRLHFIDGARGDDDLTPDGVITDAGGPAVPAADLVLTQAVAPAAPVVGRDLTFTLTVTNNAPIAAPGVIVTDPLPAGVAFVSATADQGSCTFDGSTVVCDLGTLAPGAVLTIRVVVRPTATGALTNAARVSSTLYDPMGDNNLASATVTAGRAAASPLERFVTRLYVDLVGHVPDPQTLAQRIGQLEAGVTPRRVARAVVNSREHQKLVRQHRAPHFTLKRAYLDALNAEQSTPSVATE
jgi:uncharacterized repeat protein (TIGR01451 family)